MPTDETVRRVITHIAPLIFAARHRRIVRKPSIWRILERLSDFVVFQFNTPLERKKARTFNFSKVPALPIYYYVVYPNYSLMFHLQI